MLIRAKKHVLSSYSYSNLSFHRKITKTTQKWVVFFCTKIKRRRPQKNTANVHVRRGLLTSQTAFGGQLPYKGSLVRPAAIFDHGPFGFDGMFFDYG